MKLTYQGWVCPTCNRIYGPWVGQCPMCNNKSTHSAHNWSTTHTIRDPHNFNSEGSKIDEVSSTTTHSTMMTRAEARQIIADWLVSSKCEKGQCGYIEGWFYERDVEAFRMAIEALEQEPSDDCISREWLLNAFGLSEKTRKYGGDHSGYGTLMLYEIQDVIEDAPAVPKERIKK